MRWPEFAALVMGLLSCQSRIRAVFTPPESDQPNTEDDQEVD